MKNIRNFSIIAHIDHGKSTLADRMLELTGTIEKRKMREQALDTMDLERERGITIKMTPVRMTWFPSRAEIPNPKNQNESSQIPDSKFQILDSEQYVLNLIDTPGHIDFAYEVSRALKAVDGALLLVDATQGVQAQTLSVLEMARELGLVIIPIVSKIDSPLARTNEVAEELARLLGVAKEEVVLVSGKTGEGVPELLHQIISRIPPPGLRESASSPRESASALRALVFDFEYSIHRGIVVYVRVFSGTLKKGDDLKFAVTGMRFKALEVGTLGPAQFETAELHAGEIGYVVTGAKEAARAVVGDTVTSFLSPAPALSGYKNPQPVVWASLFPEGQDDFSALKMALEELKLEDPSLAFEEELSPVLGRGFRSGFLGMLHLEIILERLKREFGTRLIVASPSIVYEVVKENGERNFVYSPAEFPDYGAYKEIYEPVAEVHVITPISYMGRVSQALYRHEAVVGESENWSGNRISFKAKLPLRELMRGFFDELKNVSSGYASFSYEIVGSQKADVVRLDILVAGERVPAFSQVIARANAYDEAKHAVERLYEILPRQLFVTKIQGVAQGRILSSKTLSVLKKDVTGYLYGGDITRKKKLWEKQKRGKKKMKERGTVEIPHDVFLKMLKKE